VSYVLVRAARCAAAAALVATAGLGGPAAAVADQPGSGGGAPGSGGGAPGGSSGNPSQGDSSGSSSGSGGGYTGDSKHLGDRILRQGMRGHDVRVLQQYLTLAGFQTSVDGDFGAATRQNVEAFERSKGLDANGVVTLDVAHALRQAVSGGQPRASRGSGTPTGKTTINSDGTATAPSGAPPAVQAVVAAANRIIDTSYCYAGGHGSWNSSCYDCSGAVSYALHGGGLLSSPLDSTGLESWGSPGPGRWITVYANAGHTFVVVAGRAFNTADYGGPNIPAGDGPRWRSNPTGNLADGGSYVERHPAGL
jgi:peptidoglycan hydrolase-like protein with peptidoglycan-binding domain